MCNAAYQMTHDELDGFPGQQITRTFETNVFGPFWLVQALRDELKGGTVIVTTSIQAMEPSSHLLDYASTKAALNNLVVNLAAELGRAGHPVEVASADVYLASDEASYVSGTVLGVTGGNPIF